MKKSHIIQAVLLISITQSIFGIQPVHANTNFSFPSCPNPGGTVVSQYGNGTHGVPGDSSQFVGSDAVYKINDTQTVQCFCPTDLGTGVQTNWLKTPDISESEINSYKNLGWVYIPDGSLWGLDASPYMAQNISITCNGGTGNGNTNGGGSSSSSSPNTVCDSAKPNAPTLISVIRNGSTATLTWSKVEFATHYSISYGVEPNKFIYGVANTGNVTQFTIGSLDVNKTYYWEVRAVNNCMPSDVSAPRGGGSVLGDSTGFASTGNMQTIVLIAGLGCILLGLSIAARNFGDTKK